MNGDVTPSGPTIIDTSEALAELGDGVHWTLARSGDLNVNLVRLEPGRYIGDHVNHDLDVVIIVIAGSGTIDVDELTSSLHPNVVADVPKGASRHIEAGPDGLGYFTIHRRRKLDIAERGPRVDDR